MNLSIIIPCYNVEKFIQSTLDSLLKYQEKCELKYEIICINDGSSDSTAKIISEYKSSKLKFINLKENNGVSNTRNLGIEEAHGEYIWFFDSDDLTPPNSLSELGKLINLNPSYEAIRFYAEFISEESTNKKILTLPHSPTNENLYCIIFKRDFIISKNIYFNKNMSYSEDIAFECLCFLNDLKVLESSQILYYYRQRQNSLMHSKDNNRYFESIKQLPIYYNTYYLNNKSEIPKNKITEYLNLIYSGVQSSLMHAVRQNKRVLNETLNELKELKLYPYPIQWKLIDKKYSFKVNVSRSIFLFLPNEKYIKFLNKLLSRNK